MYMPVTVEVYIDCFMLYATYGLLVAPSHTGQKETREDTTVLCEI
jgi:hypothetical protein